MNRKGTTEEVKVHVSFVITMHVTRVLQVVASKDLNFRFQRQKHKPLPSGTFAVMCYVKQNGGWCCSRMK